MTGERERTVQDETQDALNRMARAHNRGTGCHLTADMIAALGGGLLGQIWAEDDPRDHLKGTTDD